MFNPLGGSKYDALDIKDEFAGMGLIGAEKQEKLRKAAEKAGCQIKVS